MIETRIRRVDALGVELLDVREVATLLHCSKRHVMRMSDMGRIPRPVKLGQLVRWRRAELLSWLNSGCPSRADWDSEGDAR